VAQKFEFLREIKAVENFYMSQINSIVKDIDSISGLNDELKAKLSDNERRLALLEKKLLTA
jgi:hypothetical protein